MPRIYWLMGEAKLYRDNINGDTISSIGERLQAADAGINRDAFEQLALQGFFDLSFGDRARKILQALEVVLPDSFTEAADILVRSLGPEPEAESLSDFNGFHIMPMAMFIQKHGLEDPDTSLWALYEMTKRFTAEGEIRPFLIRWPRETLDFLERLCDDPSPFARRLASEGTRPRLPLYCRLAALQRDPSPVFPLLGRLYHDENLMVRRSVANHVNDISKDNPEAAVALLRAWHEKTPDERTRWVMRHGLRTLVKQGHAGALELLGFKGEGFRIEQMSLSSGRIELGRTLEFSCLLVSESPVDQNLVLNYLVHFVKASGKRKARRFRMGSTRLAAGGSQKITCRHKFLDYKNQSFYPGLHGLEIRANGRSSGVENFMLVIAPDPESAPAAGAQGPV